MILGKSYGRLDIIHLGYAVILFFFFITWTNLKRCNLRLAFLASIFSVLRVLITLFLGFFSTFTFDLSILFLLLRRLRLVGAGRASFRFCHLGLFFIDLFWIVLFLRFLFLKSIIRGNIAVRVLRNTAILPGFNVICTNPFFLLLSSWLRTSSFRKIFSRFFARLS